MARDDPQVNVRMPRELKEALEQMASENRRTLTAEVVARLETSLRPATGQLEAVGEVDGLVLWRDRGQASRHAETLVRNDSLLREPEAYPVPGHAQNPASDAEIFDLVDRLSRQEKEALAVLLRAVSG